MLPALPMLRIEPALPIDRTLPELPSDSTDMKLPTLAIDAMHATESTLPTLITLHTLHLLSTRASRRGYRRSVCRSRLFSRPPFFGTGIPLSAERQESPADSPAVRLRDRPRVVLEPARKLRCS